LTSWLPNDGLRYGLTIMRLCYLADPTSSHTVKWLSYFLRRGDEVHLLGWSHPTDPLLKGVIYHHLPDVLPTVFVAPARSLLWRLGAWPLAQWRQMQVLLEQIQPDIFDILMLNAGEIPAALARRGPLVITPWGSDLLVYPEHYRPPTRFFLRRALRRADLVLCNSAALAQASIAWGAQPERVRRVGQIVDLARFRPGLDGTMLRRALGIDGGPVLLSPRNLQPVYCIDVLIRAMPKVLVHYPQARLILLGKRELDPSYVARIENEIERLDLCHAVRFGGWFANDKMPQLYALADVVLSVPSSDSRPSSVFEAMACGVPVVVSDLPGLREIVTPEETGLLAPVGDAEGTAAAILRLLQDDTLRRRIVYQALAFVQREGDYVTQMAKVAGYYDELLSGLGQGTT
jgi:glycosyltransferase involved in cell wall biosynthesis